MPTIDINHIHFQIGIELRFLGIPTRWMVRHDEMHDEQVLFPKVNQRIGRGLASIRDPWDIRNQFLKMKPDDKSALEFLNQVGVWEADEDPLAVRGERLIAGPFGHRYFMGYARPITTEELSRQRDRWQSLMSSPTKLRAEFGPPPAGKVPADQDAFALQSYFQNTLSVHLELKGKYPRAVIQPITGVELLRALAWLDVVRGAKFKVCANRNCAIEYTVGGRKFCEPKCEHASTIRRYRKKKALR
jgi:hypothetical protein